MTSASSSIAQTRRTKLEEILRIAPIIPVITIERVEDAVPLARALVAGGLAARWRSPCAQRRRPLPRQPSSRRCRKRLWASAPC
jgi:hypothetical protein